ncbi:MAG: hypothetical protein LBQ50_10005, partial [Planctomycetaceae bacterium]|nr:hypothetical protein [Planctomycetaceae bacterium]
HFPPQGLRTIACSLPRAPAAMKEEVFGSAEEDTGILLMEDSAVFQTIKPDHPAQSSASETDIQIEVIEDCKEALRKVWAESASDDVICVTGSLFLAAELRKFFFEQIEPEFVAQEPVVQ